MRIRAAAVATLFALAMQLGTAAADDTPGQPAPSAAPDITTENPEPASSPASEPPPGAPDLTPVEITVPFTGEQAPVPGADAGDTPNDPAPAPPAKPRPPRTKKEREAACQQAIAGLAPTQDIRYCGWPAVPAPPDQTYVDPILGIPLPVVHGVDSQAVERLRAKVQRLRAKVAASESSVNAALAAAEQAKEAARMAQWEALLAAVRAEHATAVLERHAAGMYRSGGANPASLVTIINSASDDPGKVLDEQSYLREATSAKETELQAAAAAVQDAQSAQAAADTATAEAERASIAAQAARDQLTEDLKAAEQELETVEAAAVSSQTLVGDDGCPTAVPAGTMRGSSAGMDIAELCAQSVAQAATPEAALAIKYAFRSLGAPYACKGVGRSLPFRFDCSSLVARAYAEGAGLRTADEGWAPSTRDMVPWDGVPLAPWADFVAPQDARPGDLVLYDTGGTAYRHVVMLIAGNLMLHTNSCGDVAKIEDFWGFGNERATYLVSRRVNPEQAR